MHLIQKGDYGQSASSCGMEFKFHLGRETVVDRNKGVLVIARPIVCIVKIGFFFKPGIFRSIKVYADATGSVLVKTFLFMVIIESRAEIASFANVEICVRAAAV